MKEVIDTVSVALASGEVEELGGAVMQEVNRSLLSAGVNEEWADKIDDLIVLLFIIGIEMCIRDRHQSGSSPADANLSSL